MVRQWSNYYLEAILKILNVFMYPGATKRIWLYERKKNKKNKCLIKALAGDVVYVLVRLQQAPPVLSEDSEESWNLIFHEESIFDLKTFLAASFTSLFLKL